MSTNEPKLPGHGNYLSWDEEDGEEAPEIEYFNSYQDYAEWWVGEYLGLSYSEPELFYVTRDGGRVYKTIKKDEDKETLVLVYIGQTEIEEIKAGWGGEKYNAEEYFEDCPACGYPCDIDHGNLVARCKKCNFLYLDSEGEYQPDGSFICESCLTEENDHD